VISFKSPNLGKFGGSGSRGTILNLELEHRKGGSGLRYSFDIKVGNAIHEVGIDAKTGATLINHTEGAK